MAWVGAVLFGRDLNVIEAAEFMGLSYQLETAVLGIGSIQSNHETQHLRCDTAVVIPIAVVLMPLPGAADLWVFCCEFRLKVIDRFTNQSFRRFDDPLAAGGEPINAVAGPVPERDPCGAAFLIGAHSSTVRSPENCTSTS